MSQFCRPVKRPAGSPSVNTSRWRYCETCRAIKKDGPGHKHDHPDHKVVKLGPEQLQEAVAHVEQHEQRGVTSRGTFNFGKYKGKTVERVKKEAPS